jgi:hypothetical protein
MADHLIEFKMRGQDIQPGNLRAKDLGDFLIYVEDSIAPLVLKDNPDLSRDEIIIGLIAIRPGSVALDFSPQLPELVLKTLKVYRSNPLRVSEKSLLFVGSSVVLLMSLPGTAETKRSLQSSRN